MGLSAAVNALITLTLGAHGKPLTATTQPAPPAFPLSYEAVFTRTNPRDTSWQPSGVQLRVHTALDHRQGLARRQLSQSLKLFGEKTSYDVSPQQSRLVCRASENADGGPNWTGFNKTDIFPRRPLTWTPSGVCTSAPSGCQRWTSVEGPSPSNVTTTHTLEVNDAGHPLRWTREHSRTDGKPGRLVDFTFHTFTPGPPSDARVFEPPAACAGVTVTPAPKPEAPLHRLLGRIAALTTEYTQTLLTEFAWLEREYEAEEQAQTRRREERVLELWNARHNTTFKLGDLGPEFSVALMPLLDPNDSPVAQQGSKYKVPYEPLLGEGQQLPRHLDYRNSTLLGPVKNQELCGACYAFAAAAALEAAYAKATGERVQFSVKQQMDCGWQFNKGCHGSHLDSAFELIAQSGGLLYSRDYPYSPQDELCSLRSAQDPLQPYNASLAEAPGQIKGYAKVDSSEHALMEALFSRGPLAVHMFAFDALFAYTGGVIIEPSCVRTPLINHAVLLVGYGTTDEGIDYWILQNSWGAEWGEGGFFRVMRGQLDCNIRTGAYYPLLPENPRAPALAPVPTAATAPGNHLEAITGHPKPSVATS